MKSLKSFTVTNRILLIIAILFLCIRVSAEVSGIITGKITDEKNQPIGFATAALITPDTRKIIQGKISNEQGEFTMEKVGEGEYILTVSMVGYEKNESEKVVVNSKNTVFHKTIVLKEATQHLKDVVVTGKKQFIEQTVDKTVVNPEASITSSTESVYEILKKLPGVTIDNNDNISLKGKEGVKILIDEKPTYVSASQLASLLKSMQGKNVERIEIIENPPARFDAEGNSGIINIKTKHLKAPGFNGSANAGMSLASKFGWNGGLDLNMNLGKVNLYGSYALYNWAGINSMMASRRFTTTDLAGSYQLIDAVGTYRGHAHNYKVGADYFIRKNHVVSVMFRGNNGVNRDHDSNNTSFTNPILQVDSSLLTSSGSNNRWNNQTYNANYKWDIDTTGQSLTIDMDYARFFFRSVNEQNGTYFDTNGNDLNHDILVNTTQGNNIDIYTAKADYVLPLGKKFNFETGLKSSMVNTNSQIDMRGFLNQYDHFIYKENIMAGYVNGRLQLDKTTLQLGLRLEDTYSNGTSVTTGEVNKNSYLKLFPSFFVQQTLNANNNLNFKYSYRIGRPSYHMLNPFRWMIDPYTYNVGNPNLRPQFTHSLSLGHTYKGMFITTLGYNYTSDLFTEIIRQDDATKTVYQTMENLSNAIDMNLSETMQLQPAKWWRLNGTLTGIYKQLNLFGTTGSRLERWSFEGNLTNNLTLPLKLEMEISGYYTTSQLISNIVTRPRYSIDLGVQRKILKDQGVIKISVSDIFDTNNGSAYARYNNVDIDVKNNWDARRLNISFNYRFGKDNFSTRSNRSTASSEEQNRSSK